MDYQTIVVDTPNRFQKHWNDPPRCLSEEKLPRSDKQYKKMALNELPLLFERKLINQVPYLMKHFDVPPVLENMSYGSFIEEVRQVLMVPGSFIAGGCFTNPVAGLDSVKDIDVFFSSQEAVDLFVKGFLSRKKEVFSKHYYYDNGRTDGGEYSNKKVGPSIATLVPLVGGLPEIQIIAIGFYNDCAHVVDHFDFTVCQMGMDHEGAVWYSDEFFEDVRSKTFRLNFVEDAKRLKRRVARYEEKGFTPHPSVLEKLEDLCKKDPFARATSDFWEAYKEFDSPKSDVKDDCWTIDYSQGHFDVVFGDGDRQRMCLCKPVVGNICRTPEGKRVPRSLIVSEENWVLPKLE